MSIHVDNINNHVVFEQIETAKNLIVDVLSNDTLIDDSNKDAIIRISLV